MAGEYSWLRALAPEIVNKPGYRGDIDALRGIAITFVLLFHFFPDVSFGFLGVDIFFTISGYLISGIIISQLERGQFSYLDFYARRIRRLFPSLLLVLSVVLVLVWIYFLPEYSKNNMKYIAGGIFFIDNILFYNTISYFTSAQEGNLCLHLWSLGIEEQFYICAPLLLAALWKLLHTLKIQKKFSFYLLLLYLSITILSLVYCQSVSGIQEKAFYLPQSRIWEIAVGGLAAVLERYAAVRSFCMRFSLLLAVLGAGCLILGCILITPVHFPNMLALLPVCGTALLLVSVHRHQQLCHAVSRPCLIWLGLISYALYLWHWPVISLTAFLWGWPLPLIRCLLLLASIFLGAVTFRFWERKWRFSRIQWSVPSLATSSLVLAGLAMLVMCNTSPSALKAISNDWLPENSYQTVFEGEQVRGLPGTLNTVLYGDSLAQQYFPRAMFLCSREEGERKRGVIMVHSSHYPPYPGSALLNQRDKGIFEKFIKVCSSDRVDTVIISGFFRGAFGGESWAPVLLDGKLLDPDKDWDKVVAAWKKLMTFLVEKKKKIYLVYPNPIDSKFSYRKMFRYDIFPPKRIFDPQPARCNRALKDQRVYAFVQSLAAEYGAIFIDPADYLCQDGQLWPLDTSGNPIMMDHMHFRASYVEKQITYLDDAFWGR